MLLAIVNRNGRMQKQMETCNLFIKDVTKSMMSTHLEIVVSFAAWTKIKVHLNKSSSFTSTNIFLSEIGR